MGSPIPAGYVPIAYNPQTRTYLLGPNPQQASQTQYVMGPPAAFGQPVYVPVQNSSYCPPGNCSCGSCPTDQQNSPQSQPVTVNSPTQSADGSPDDDSIKPHANHHHSPTQSMSNDDELPEEAKTLNSPEARIDGDEQSSEEPKVHHHHSGHQNAVSTPDGDDGTTVNPQDPEAAARLMHSPRAEASSTDGGGVDPGALALMQQSQGGSPPSFGMSPSMSSYGRPNDPMMMLQEFFSDPMKVLLALGTLILAVGGGWWVWKGRKGVASVASTPSARPTEPLTPASRETNSTRPSRGQTQFRGNTDDARLRELVDVHNQMGDVLDQINAIEGTRNQALTGRRGNPRLTSRPDASILLGTGAGAGAAFVANRVLDFNPILPGLGFGLETVGIISGAVAGLGQSFVCRGWNIRSPELRSEQTFERRARDRQAIKVYNQLVKQYKELRTTADQMVAESPHLLERALEQTRQRILPRETQARLNPPPRRRDRRANPIAA